MNLVTSTFAVVRTANKLDERTTSAIQDFLYGPYVTYALYSAIAIAFIGVLTKLHKFTAAGGLGIILICAFRLFSAQLTSATGIFQAKVIVPVFILTLTAKLVSGYIKKKREEKREEEEEEAKAAHKRRSVTADTKTVSGGLTRFGDSHERKSNLQKSLSDRGASGSSGAIGSSQASNSFTPKLNRNF